MGPSLWLRDPAATLSTDNFWDTGLPKGRSVLRLGRRSQLGNKLLPGNFLLFLDTRLTLKSHATWLLALSWKPFELLQALHQSVPQVAICQTKVPTLA